MRTLVPHQPFLFIRHGQTDWNVEGRLQSHTDNPLNETGKQQAQQASQQLTATSFDFIVSSPLIRALQTASAFSQAHQKPIWIEHNLREATFGDWEGLTHQKIADTHNIPVPSGVKLKLNMFTNYYPANAELFEQTCQRLTTCVTSWLTRYPNKTILFVSHGIASRALVSVLTGNTISIDNATPYRALPPVNLGDAWQIEKTA